MAELIDGKAIAARIETDVAEGVGRLAREQGYVPGLAVVLVGEDPASLVYVGRKSRKTRALGMRSIEHRLAADASERELLGLIGRLNRDPVVHGILVQLPLPAHIDSARVLDAIDPRKDVDGFHPVNVGRLSTGTGGLVPCTPLGCMRLIEHAGVQIAGLHAVIVGRSNIVGKPVAHLLLQKDATVTICHSKSKDLVGICRSADILVAAVGRAKLVTGAMVKPGACVIDVGINRLPDGKLAGDVDFESAKEVAGWITPVPGGVGPMTIAMLLENCIRAAGAKL